MTGAKSYGKTLGQGRAEGGRRLKLARPDSSIVAYTLWRTGKGGVYDFELACDDYGRLYLDGELIIRQKPDRTAGRKNTASIKLSSGLHLLKAVLHNGPNEGWLQLKIREPGSKQWRILPAEQMGYIKRGNIAEMSKLLEYCPVVVFLGLLALAIAGALMALRGLLGARVRATAQWLAGVLHPANPLPAATLSIRGMHGPWLILAGLAVLLELAFLLSKRSYLSMFGHGEIVMVALNAIAIFALLPLAALWAAVLARKALGNPDRSGDWIQRASLFAWGFLPERHAGRPCRRLCLHRFRDQPGGPAAGGELDPGPFDGPAGPNGFAGFNLVGRPPFEVLRTPGPLVRLDDRRPYGPGPGQRPHRLP